VGVKQRKKRVVDDDESIDIEAESGDDEEEEDEEEKDEEDEEDEVSENAEDRKALHKNRNINDRSGSSEVSQIESEEDSQNGETFIFAFSEDAYLGACLRLGSRC